MYSKIVWILAFAGSACFFNLSGEEVKLESRDSERVAVVMTISEVKPRVGSEPGFVRLRLINVGNVEFSVPSKDGALPSRFGYFSVYRWMDGRYCKIISSPFLMYSTGEFAITLLEPGELIEGIIEWDDEYKGDLGNGQYLLISRYSLSSLSWFIDEKTSHLNPSAAYHFSILGEEGD